MNINKRTRDTAFPIPYSQPSPRTSADYHPARCNWLKVIVFSIRYVRIIQVIVTEQ